MTFTLTVGKGTIFHEHLGDPHIIDYGTYHTNITFGKYCSNGTYITILVGGSEHPYNRVITYGFSYGGHKLCSTKGDIHIGNDVWLGHGITILSGVTIGDGAVIGACSVVSKNIPPYAIAVGNPIRVIKYRFDSETIEKLLKIAWWDKGEKFIEENADLLLDENNVQEFIRRYG